MLSDIPKKLEKLGKKDIDNEILRTGMIAELDAVSLYEQMAVMTDDKAIKKVLLDIAKEEKTHMAEFEALLLNRDKEQAIEMGEGKKEIKKLAGE